MERVQKSVFDLDSFDEMTLVKEFEFSPVASVEEAVSRLGGDSAKLLEVLNDGLREEVRSQIRNTDDGWHTFSEDNPDEINGEFTGTIADPKAVNSLVLTLAKTVFGFSKELTKEQKRAAKESAKSMIRDSEPIKSGLRKSAAKK